MQINRFRRYGGTARQIPVFTNPPSEAALSSTTLSIPIPAIPHVGLPRMLPIVAGPRSEEEILLPSLEGEACW